MQRRRRREGHRGRESGRGRDGRREGNGKREGEGYLCTSTCTCTVYVMFGSSTIAE